MPDSTSNPPQRNSLLSAWIAAASLLCIGFGVLLIGLIHPLGDGGWFWYAVLFRQGHHIYSELHLPLQPMLVLQTAWLQRIFGTSWIASLAPGLFNVLLYLAGLLLVLRRLAWPAWQRAILLAAVFLTTTDFITFRFDDYHVLSACFVVYSVALLLALRDAITLTSRLWISVGLGALAGLCLANRLNDGAALLLASLLVATFYGIASRRDRPLTVLATPAVITIAAFLALVLTVALTGDSLRDWWHVTVVEAAAIKGGTGHVLRYPFDLPRKTIALLLQRQALRLSTLSIVLIGLLTFLAGRPARRSASGRRNARILFATALLVTMLFVLVVAKRNLAEVLTEIAVLLAFIAMAWAIVEAARHLTRSSASPTGLLLLLPFGQLCSIAMSSGQWYPNAFPPVAIFLLVLPFAAPGFFHRTAARTALLTFVAALGFAAGSEKFRNPFNWWCYRAASITEPHTWYRHPIYGPMWIETRNLNFIEPVCSTINASAGPHDLLSLPYPYANYFCGTPPWHNTVQTFFDTTSPQTIQALMASLNTAPPAWIFYQRQPDVLRAHEVSFHAGQPLPHRALDELITAKLQSGAWHVALTEPDRDPRSTWYLIQTGH